MRLTFALLLILCGNWAVAQKQIHLQLSGLPKSVKQIIPENFQDSASAYAGLKKQLNYTQFLGYFDADIKNFEWQSDSLLKAEISIGGRYEGIFIKNGNLTAPLLNQSFLRDLLIRKKPLSLNSLQKLYQKILDFYENNGYPFATVWLDSLNKNNHQLTAKLFAEPNQKFTIDTMRLVGEAKLNQGFLSAYLGLKKGQDYEEAKIQEMDKKLKDLPFVTVPKPTQVIFSGEKAKINLFLNKQNANQFDGIIGFLPNANNGKLQLTGDFKLSLKNALKSGESFDFNYRGLPSQSQELVTHLNYPYLFRSQLGLNFDFQLFKRDTSFLNLNTKIAFDYSFSSTKKLSFYYESFSGNQVATPNQNTNNLPPYANIKTSFYGLSGAFVNLDDKITPLKGEDFMIEAGVGNRRLLSSANFNPDDYFASRNQIQYKLSANLKYYIKLGSRSVLFLHHFSSFLSGNQLFQNEGFRIGGAKTLRGFDEQSILASSFAIQTAELRYIIEKNSYLSAFTDQAFVQQNFVNQQSTDHPIGFGLGITFQTKVGIASLSYALGKQKNIPLDLQKGKIHFGIVSYF